MDDFEKIMQALGGEGESSRANGNGGPVVVGNLSSYAEAAFDREIEKLSAAQEGFRNQQLFDSACNLFEFVKAGMLPEAPVVNALESAALATGLGATEVTKSLQSAYRKVQPRQVEQGVAPADADALQLGDVGVPRADDDLPEPLDWADIENLSDEVDWLLEDVFERGRLYALYAAAKTGKSIFMQYWVAKMAQDGLVVMYVDQENTPKDLHERFFKKMNYKKELLQNLLYFSFPNMPYLDTPAGAVKLERLAAKYKPDLVVFDTTARFIKESEQESDTFKALSRLAHTPLKRMGITQVRIDHAGKDAARGQRGASGKNDDVDAVLRLEKGDDINGYVKYTLHCELQRSGNSPNKKVYQFEESSLKFTPIEKALDLEASAPKSVNDYLDRWGAPNQITNNLAKQMFHDRGIPIPGGNQGLCDAVRERKHRGYLSIVDTDEE